VRPILLSAVLPLNLVIWASLSDPPALIFASLFSRRMRACRCAGVSSAASAMLDQMPRLKQVSSPGNGARLSRKES